MSKTKFGKAPDIDKQKETKLDNFLNLRDNLFTEKSIDAPHKKEKKKSVYLRAPESIWYEIQEVVALTGLSMNAICMDILRQSIKRKLKELKSE